MAASRVKFFLDRDLGKRLGRALREVGVEVQLHTERYPGIGDIPDEEWIPAVAADGYVILTHDQRIDRGSPHATLLRPLVRGS